MLIHWAYIVVLNLIKILVRRHLHLLNENLKKFCLGQVQMLYFTWAESNANEQNPLFSLICIRFGSCEVRHMNLALVCISVFCMAKIRERLLCRAFIYENVVPVGRIKVSPARLFKTLIEKSNVQIFLFLWVSLGHSITVCFAELIFTSLIRISASNPKSRHLYVTPGAIIGDGDRKSWAWNFRIWIIQQKVTSHPV